MNYKLKLKSKFFLYNILGILTIIVILCIAYLFEKTLETFITMILFYIYRCFYTKQFHAKSLYLCSLVSIIIFIFIIQFELKFETSILFSAVFTFAITTTSYIFRDYLDTKAIGNKLENFNRKCIENLTEQEIISIMPNIKYDVIHIVYEYLHKDKTLTASAYAYKCGISDATLYRYVKQVKKNYESLGK